MDLTCLDVVLTIKNSILEPITERHADLLFKNLQSEELYAYIPRSPPQTVSDLKAKYNKWAKRKSPSGDELWLNYAIFDKEINSYVGTIQATIQFSGKNYIAYEVFPEFQRRKIATDAVSLLIEFIQKNFSVCVVTAHVDTRNLKSYKFLESLGFERKGFIQNADFFDGKSSDEYVYELTAYNKSMQPTANAAAD